MDNDDTAAATIAAVAAAAAASHQAQEQQHLNDHPDDAVQTPAINDGSDDGARPNDTADGSNRHGDVDNDQLDDEASERFRKEAEEAAQQAVVAAAAAHRAHQEKQQQQRQGLDRDDQTSSDSAHQSTSNQTSHDNQGPSARSQQSGSNHNSDQKPPKQSRPRSAPSPNGGQSKRRKINTCLQCKARKVKCDKERPLCGPCRKHGIAEACTWADEDTGSQWTSGDFTQSTQGQQSSSSWSAQNNFGNSFSNGAASGAGLVSDPQAMVERIVQLEAQLAQQRSQNGEGSSFYDSNNNSYSHGAGANLESFLGGGGSGAGADRASSGDDATATASQQLAAWSTQFANVSEAERGMAADALAMIAQHHPQNRNSLGALASGTSNLLSGIRFPFSIRPTPEVLREATNLLPTDENIDYLLNHILSPLYMTGVCHCASPRLVAIQFARFQSQREAGDTANVDVSFLALLFLLLVLATDFADVADILARNIVEKEESISGLIELWLATGEALLSMADFTGSPSLNCLMALTAARHFYASQGRKVQYDTTSSLSLTLAQALGLHRLGSAREDEARWLSEGSKAGGIDRSNVVGASQVAENGFDSPDEHVVRDALGASKYASFKMGAHWQLPDRSHLVRETGRKLWYFLVCKDWIDCAQDGHIYHAVPGQWNTAFPLNVDEEELPDGSGDNPYRLPPEKAPGHPSDAVAYPYFQAVCNVCAEIADAYAWDKKPSYEDILSFDAKWRKVIDELPVYLRLDGHSEHLPYVRDQEHHRPFLASMRFALLEAINHRLILLHRSFLVKGHQDARYEHSVKAAVDAARMVVFCRQSVLQTGMPIQKYWAFRHHAFNAAMLLCMHLLQLARKGIRDTEETSRLREEIAVALTMIDDNKRTNAFPAGEVDAYATSKQIITRLVSEVDLQVSRDAAEAARDNNSAESLEGLYTHAGDTSEDQSTLMGGANSVLQQQQEGDGQGQQSHEEAGDITADLDQLLSAFLSRSANNTTTTTAAPAQDKTAPTPSSLGSDSDLLWRMIDDYARPSFV